MAYTTIPPSSGGAGSTVLARSQALLGSTITKVLGSDFDNDQWYRALTIGGAGGTITPSITKKGGVVTLASSATATRSVFLFPHGVINLLDNAKTSRFYHVARFAVTSAVNNVAVCDTRLCAQSVSTIGAPSLILGLIGSISTTFFSYLMQNDAGTVTQSGATTVPLDTGMHVFEIWGDTININFAIDGTVVFTGVVADAGANPCAPAIGTDNGGTTTSRTIDADYLWLCTGDPA